MKRSIRWIFFSLAALSLFLFLLMAASWARSYWYSDTVYWDAYAHYRSFESDRGDILLLEQPVLRGIHAPQSLLYPKGWHHLSGSTTVPPYKSRLWEVIGHADYHRFAKLGFAINHSVTIAYPPIGNDPSYGVYEGFYGVYFPHWFALIVLGILPAIGGWTLWRKHRRLLAGICHTCGYDLRASPDCCPECGTIPPSRTGKAT